MSDPRPRRRQPLSEPKDEVVIDADHIASMGRLVVPRQPKAIGDIPLLYIEALRRAVVGIEAEAYAHLGMTEVDGARFALGDERAAYTSTAGEFSDHQILNFGQAGPPEWLMLRAPNDGHVPNDARFALRDQTGAGSGRMLLPVPGPLAPSSVPGLTA